MNPICTCQKCYECDEVLNAFVYIEREIDKRIRLCSVRCLDIFQFRKNYLAFKMKPFIEIIRAPTPTPENVD